jgi:hypothetical protein
VLNNSSDKAAHTLNLSYDGHKGATQVRGEIGQNSTAQSAQPTTNEEKTNVIWKKKIKTFVCTLF